MIETYKLKNRNLQLIISRKTIDATPLDPVAAAIVRRICIGNNARKRIPKSYISRNLLQGGSLLFRQRQMQEPDPLYLFSPLHILKQMTLSFSGTAAHEDVTKQSP